MSSLFEYTLLTGQYNTLTQTYRYVIPASELNGTAGSIQLQFYYDDTDYAVTAYVYIQASSGNVYDGALGSGVRITLGGSSPCVVTGPNSVSDVISFNITGEDNIVIACHRSLAVAPYKSGLPTNCQTYQLVGVTEAAVAHVVGYSSYSSWPFIEKILGYGIPVAHSPSVSPSEGTPSSSPSEGTPSEGTPSGTPSPSPSEGTPSSSPSYGTPSGTPSPSPSAGTPSSSPSEGTPSGTPSDSPSRSPSSSPSEGTPSVSPSGSPSVTPSTSPDGNTSLFYHDATWSIGVSVWSGSRRLLIDKNDLTNTPHIGGQVRLRFAYSGTPYQVQNIFVWEQASSGDLYDGEPGTRVSVSKGGVEAFTIDGPDQFSDPITFDVDGTTSVLIAIDVVSSYLCYTNTMPANSRVFYKYGSIGETGVPDVLGFSEILDWPYIESIERIPEEGTPSSSPSEATPSNPSEGTPSSTPSSSPSEATPSSSPSEATPSASPTPKALDPLFYFKKAIQTYSGTRSNRCVIKPIAWLFDATGYKIRLKFLWSTIDTAYTVKGFIYKKAISGNAWDGDAQSRVELKKDGNTIMSITSEADSYSDLIDFEIKPSDTIVVALDRIDWAPGNTEYSAGTDSYYKLNVHESFLPAVDGYIKSSWWYHLEGIYVETPSSPSPSPSEATPSSSPSSSPSHGTPSDSPSEATPSSSPSYGTPSQGTPSDSPSEATPSGDISFIKNIELGIIGDGSTGSIYVYSLLIDNYQIGNFDFPLNYVPYSIVSDDGRVQWKLISRSYSTGGIPKNLEFEVLPTNTIPEGFTNTNTNKTNSSNQEFKYVASRIFGGYYYFYPVVVGDTLWHVEGEFIHKWELDNNMQVTYYKIPPHYYSEIDYQDEYGYVGYSAFTYCALDGLIHIVGGPTSTKYTSAHSTFDPESGAFNHESHAPAPRRVYLGYMFDASNINGKLYYFCDDNSASTADEARVVWWYDVAQDKWGSILGRYPAADGPELTAIVEDPYMIGHFLLIGYGYEMYRFNPAVTKWTPQAEYFELVDDSGDIYGYRETFAFTDKYTGLVVVAYYDDLVFWDATVGIPVWQHDYVDTWQTDSYFKWYGQQGPWDLDQGKGAVIPGSNNNYYLHTTEWDYYDNWALYALNKSIKLRWDGHD